MRVTPSIEGVEMMDRPVAVTNAEPVRLGDGRADIGLGVMNRGLQGLALRLFGCDGGGQRAAGAVSVRGGDARRGEEHDAVLADQVIDTLRPLSVAAFHENRCATHGQ